jgi:protein phosphatase
MKIRGTGSSDQGRRRPSNEDSFLADQEQGLFVVADGMGGHAAGEVASRLAVEMVERTLRQKPDPQENAGASIQHAIREANQAIVEKTQTRPDLQGMGTTLVMAFVENATAWIGHVGDSRAYRIRGDSIELLTRDHSWVSEQMRLGHLSAEEASHHPWRHVITRALGSRDEVEAEVWAEPLRSGDLLLLCSDGLSSMADEQQMLAAVRESGGDLEDACRRLIELANAGGGEDNITVVLVEAAGGGRSPKTP